MHPPNRRRQHPVNRRLPRPSPARAVASRRSSPLAGQARRLVGWLRALPGAIHDALAGKPAAGSAVLGEPRTWDRQRSAAAVPPPPRDPEPARPIITPRDDADDLDIPLENLADPGLSAAHTTVYGRSPRLLAAPDFDLPGDRSSEPPPIRTRAPSLGSQAAVLGRRLNAHASEFGRQLAPRAAEFGRKIRPLAHRGARMTGRGLRAAVRRLAELRPLLTLLRRFLASVGELTLRLLAACAVLLTVSRRGLVAGVVRHRALLFGLFTRAMWWGALVLLLLGGQALVEIHGRAPLDQQALPAFAAGLGLCALLVVIAAQARLRWAALVLGFSHGGLLALVWVVAAAIRH